MTTQWITRVKYWRQNSTSLVYELPLVYEPFEYEPRLRSSAIDATLLCAVRIQTSSALRLLLVCFLRLLCAKAFAALFGLCSQSREYRTRIRTRGSRRHCTLGIMNRIAPISIRVRVRMVILGYRYIRGLAVNIM